MRVGQIRDIDALNVLLLFLGMIGGGALAFVAGRGLASGGSMDAVRNALFLAAFVGGLVALIGARGARRRLLGLSAMLAAFVGFGIMPM